MKRILFVLGVFCAAAGCVLAAKQKGEAVSIFDGKTFHGWEGDTNKTWHIAEKSIVGGDGKITVPHNEFICTERPYTNFVLHLKFKLTGTNGFVNGGVQFRSQRIPNHFEAAGYQADLGEPEWWGCLYDESRRNKVLVKSDIEAVNKILRRNDWNDYKIRCDGKRIQLWLNGLQTVDYTEMDDTIATSGVIGLQIHGGGQTEVFYKDISVEKLP